MKKSLFVTICGAPNAGKSTLLNKIIGSKISIVSHRVQTTRENIRGILTENDIQIVFIDTPGIFKSSNENDKELLSNAHSAINEEGCLLCLVIDGTKGITGASKTMMERLKEKNKKIIIVINKVDETKDQDLLELTQKIYDDKYIEEVFMVSAKTGAGIHNFVEYLKKKAQKDVWYYTKDDITDKGMNFLISEILREKIFKFIKQEIPYQIKINTDKIYHDKDPILINQTIEVQTDNQKKIIIGSNGSLIKKIAQYAKQDIEELFDKSILLDIVIKKSNNT